jgi:hypothetical protein
MSGKASPTLREIASGHTVTSRGKRKPRGVKRKMSEFNLRKRGQALKYLPEPLIEIIRPSLQGERFVPVGEAFEITSSLPQGHVQAGRSAMKRLDLASLLGSRPSRSRDRVLVLVAARIVSPLSKLSTSRAWHTTTLASDFCVAEANEDELYATMDWRLSRSGVDPEEALGATSEGGRAGTARFEFELFRRDAWFPGAAGLPPGRQERVAASQLRLDDRCAELSGGGDGA